MKGFARRNQLIITGLAIMIAVAGYLHFTSEGGTGLSETDTEEQENKWMEEKDAQAYLLTDDDDSVETMTEDTNTQAEQTDEKKEKKKKEKKQKEDQYADLSAEDLGVDDDGEKAVAQNDEEKEVI